MLDAYTIRKIAPRLLIAVIGINLSIYLCVAAIDITNVVGRGLAQLIAAPFDVAGAQIFELDQGSSNLAFGTAITGGVFGGAALVLVALSGGPLAMIFFTLLPVILTVLAILVTLVVRQALLVLLTLFSPIAIACLVLPGTEKYFKQWWDLFLKTLLVYPIVAALFALSDVMATISLSNTDRPEVGNVQGAANIVIGLLLVFIPLFLIPFAFKFSGGAIAGIMNQASQLSEPLVRLARRKRQQGLERGWENTKSGNFIRGNNRFARRASSVAQSMALAPQAISKRPRQRLTRLKGDAETVGAGKLGEDPGWQQGAKFDDLLRAGLVGKTRAQQEAYLMSKEAGGIWQDKHRREAGVEWIQQQQRKAGVGAFREASINALASNSTAFPDHASAMELVVGASGGDPARMTNMWARVMEGQERAGRPVNGGGSFSKVVESMAEVEADMAENGGKMSQETRDKINARAARSVWGRKGGPATFSSNKPADAKALVDAGIEEDRQIARRLAMPDEGNNRVMELYDPETDKYVERKVTAEDRDASLAKMQTAYEAARSNGAEVRSQVARMLETEMIGETVPVFETNAKGERVQAGEKQANYQEGITKRKGSEHFVNLLYDYSHRPGEVGAREAAAAAGAAAERAKPPEPPPQ